MRKNPKSQIPNPKFSKIGHWSLVIGHSPKGFTLAEVVVVTALFAILVTLIAGIFLYNNRFYENQTGKIASINATREGADRLNEFARQAVGLENSYVYNSVTYTSTTTVVVFRLPAIEADDDIVAGVFDHAIFGAKPSQPARLELIIVPDAASARLGRELLISDKLTSINLTYNHADPSQATSMSYEIRVTEGGRHPVTEEVFGTATLRN